MTKARSCASGNLGKPRDRPVSEGAGELTRAEDASQPRQGRLRVVLQVLRFGPGHAVGCLDDEQSVGPGA